MAERRYTEEEIAAIFKAAAERQQLLASGSAPDAQDAIGSAGSGSMTLAQVQEIAREVGIPPDLVAQAATSLDRVGRAEVRRHVGLPIGVGRTVSLGRKLSDAEWERLVVDLRETFDARGRVRDDGTFKQWTNGNLQALLEPTPDGQQVRLKTMNGSSYTSINVGIAMLVFSAALEIGKVLGMVQHASVVALALVGAGLVAVGALRLPGWARLRQRQMEAIAARLTQDESRTLPSA